MQNGSMYFLDFLSVLCLFSTCTCYVSTRKCKASEQAACRVHLVQHILNVVLHRRHRQVMRDEEAVKSNEDTWRAGVGEIQNGIVVPTRKFLIEVIRFIVLLLV